MNRNDVKEDELLEKSNLSGRLFRNPETQARFEYLVKSRSRINTLGRY